MRHTMANRKTTCLKRGAAALMAAVLLATAGTAAADQPGERDPHRPPQRDPSRPEPFLEISVSPEELNFLAEGPGEHDADSDLVVHVASNYPHGGIVVEMSELQYVDGNNGAALPPERVAVRGPVTEDEYVPLAQPVNVTGPMEPGLWDVTLEFQATTEWPDPAGLYSGTLTITCTE